LTDKNQKAVISWGHEVKERLAHIQTLMINVDNGSENHSRRTQFRSRLVNWVKAEPISIRLAYYPPYYSYSKYNRVERAFGWLEPH